MSVTRVFSCSLVAVFAMACASDLVSPSLSGFAYSTVAPQCGPAGGPAAGVFLAPSLAGANEAATPYVRVFVPVSVDQLTGVWPIAPNTEAGAWFHKDGTTYEFAESGYMIVTSVDSDYTVTGSVDLRFPDAGHIKTPFRAKIRPNVALCI